MAMGDVNYDGLLEDLLRYGGHDEAYWREKHPTMTVEMIEEAMQVSDECPFCLKRFIQTPFVFHVSGCPIGNGTLAEMSAHPNHPGRLPRAVRTPSSPQQTPQASSHSPHNPAPPTRAACYSKQSKPQE